MTETFNRDVRADSEAAFTDRDGDRILTWRWPWLYRVLFRLSPTSQRVRAKEIDAVLARIDAVSRPGQSVIEVGCGPGTYTRHLAPRFAHVTALDPAHGMIDHMTRRMAREGHRNVIGAHGWLPDGLSADAAADGVVVVGVLDFADDLVEWLSALRACVTPGGWLVFTVPSARTVSRMAGATEGLLAGRVHTREVSEVHGAAADAGLRDIQLSVVEDRGRAIPLVGSAVAS
jgi:SAM-dependent methyltransferase